MSTISGYPARSFDPSQKFLVLDPSTQTTALVLGSDLVSYITPSLDVVRTNTTRAAALNEDYDIGTFVQTAGGAAIDDGGNGMYLVVAAGDGDYAMLNGNELLLLPFGTLVGSDLDGALVTDDGVQVTIQSAIAKREVHFTSLAALLASTCTYDHVTVDAANEGGSTGRMELYNNGTTGTPTTNGNRFSALAAGTFFNAGGIGYSLRLDQDITDTMFGAVADAYVTECLTARQQALDFAGANKVRCILSAGCLQTGQLTVNYVQRITDLAIRSAPTKVLLSHTGTALKFATNETPCYEGGWYSHFDGSIGSPTWGTLRSRTGVGLDVFGDSANGSSVQVQMTNVGFEGFGINGQFAACFNSSFRALTFKRGDINYKLLNDTNQSVVFIGCKANLSCSQHIIADGIDVGSGETTTGATFLSCEFENADTFPHTHVQGGVNFQLDFINCYTFENNFGSAAGSQFRAMQADISGRLHMSHTPVNSTGKSDSILFYGRRNGSAVPWDIALDGCRLYSVRTTAGDEFDIDFAAGDSIRIMPSCFYSNTLDSDHTISSYDQFTLFEEGILYSTKSVRLSLFGFDSDVYLRASGNHLRFSNGDANNWEKGHFVFRQGTTDYHLFVDTSGNLRIKSGIPASATDGTVVGTQT